MKLKPYALPIFLTVLLVFSSCSTKKPAQTPPQNAINYAFVIPSVVTPNGDGKNDVACFVATQDEIDPADESVTIAIFSRWGQKIWETKNLTNCWDGTNYTSDKPSPSGTYFVKIEQNKEEKLSGAITLMR